ncbi:hypothetical protein A3J23_00565 [Candidatus Peregrinibacteria bacterium RIFCSPLOWO2_02_FULL_48_14]|nr:MAG: hypothetical protein A3J23_00565 [Candidatus Peregrinibacteria bacterium RIFCSPLOWO2_02_FULL_48_14]
MKVSHFVHYEPGETPLILDMPHSAVDRDISFDNLPEAIKKVFRFESAAALRTLNIGVDHAVPCMTPFHERGDSKVWTALPRVFCDPNRAPNDVDALSVDGAPEGPNAHGLIWRASVARDETAIEDLLKRPYTRKEFEEIVETSYNPYHAALKEAINKTRDRFGIAIVLGLHTFLTSQPKKLTQGRYAGAYVLGEEMPRGSLAQGTGLPDLILIHNDHRAASLPIIETVRGTFIQHGYLVEDGTGHLKGDNGITAMYGRPEEGIHVVGLEFVPHGIEINRAEGSLELDLEQTHQIQRVYNATFNRLDEFARVLA